jgi:hypothetical protein
MYEQRIMKPIKIINMKGEREGYKGVILLKYIICMYRNITMKPLCTINIAQY